MTDRTSITATRAPDGVMITVYAKGGTVVVRTTLEWRRAMLLGLDLCSLAAEPFFTAGQKDPARDGPGPVHPPAGTPASMKVESHDR